MAGNTAPTLYSTVPEQQHAGNSKSSSNNHENLAFNSRSVLPNTTAPRQKHFVLRTNARGRCEGEVEAGHTYFIHVATPGYYPVQISALCVPPETNIGASSSSSSSTSKGSGVGKGAGSSTHVISLLPLVERVDISVGDLETGQNIRAKGIEVTLINRRTATRHMGITGALGVTKLDVPRGSYRIQVGAPLFDEIPYVLTSDKAAMSFIETATAFDKARRDTFQKKEIRISVQRHVKHFVGIPSIPAEPLLRTTFLPASLKFLAATTFAIICTVLALLGIGYRINRFLYESRRDSTFGPSLLVRPPFFRMARFPQVL